MKEARARIKINKLLEEAGWYFLDQDGHKANILLENHTRITGHAINEMGEDYETTSSGFVDFLLFDQNGFPLIVLEAKAEHKSPLDGKEQARRYAREQGCRFVILSNGNQHYLWDIQRGSPQIISRFPTPESVSGYAAFQPDTAALIKEPVESDYIARTQRPDYRQDPGWRDLAARPAFIAANRLAFLRPYQLNALKAIQQSVRQGKDRFLFEMATGTGKTLVSAAVIKLMLRTANARRVLFLVDRLELEDQAAKAFKAYLKNDYRCVIYKENRDDWHKAEIVVSTVQTFLSKNRYKRLFQPDDFDFVISDEAHRSIGGNSRAVFEYFIGYKLGLTATPKEYLKNIDAAHLSQNDPRELERRMLLDTYQTFGCPNGVPTFRYSLKDGVADGFLINPVVVDARTEITTQLLSDQGYAVLIASPDAGEDENAEVKETFFHKDFEKKFFSDPTNRVFCRAFLENALRDPISDEIGKSIVFCVSQKHAATITQMLNEEADQMFPGKYQSDFAIQVTSSIPGAQQFSINFTNNNLSGNENFMQNYRTSKTRVCVTVGMMTTGYDCPDVLNLALMRPIFSPTDFIQIKGRGTRRHNFSEQVVDPRYKKRLGAREKDKYKLFDFFANVEYFEREYQYDQILTLPRVTETAGPDSGLPPRVIFEGDYESTRADLIHSLTETAIGVDGMRIDRMYFEKFGQRIKSDPDLLRSVEAGAWEEVDRLIEERHLDKPTEFFTREKIRQALNSDRHVSLREVVEYVLGLIPRIKDRAELAEDAFDRFDTRCLPPEEHFDDARAVFTAYLLDPEFRSIVDTGAFARLNLNPNGPAFQRIPASLARMILNYIKDNIPLNPFLAS